MPPPQVDDWTTLPLADDLSDALSRWQSWLRLEKRASIHTAQSYLFDVQNLLRFLNHHHGQQIHLAILANLGLSDFRSWLAHNAAEQRQAATRARAVAGVRNFFRWLDRSGQMHNAAIGLLTLPKMAQRLPRPVSESDARDLLAEANDGQSADWIGLRDQALFTLLYGAGLRISEALNLTPSDLTQPDRITVTGKGKKQRQVPLLPIVRDSLMRYGIACPYPQHPNKPLFVGVRGERLNPAVAQRHLRHLRQQLNLPDSVTPHALRHSFATHLLADGADLRSLQELLGHSSLSTTQLYTRIDGQQLQQTYRATHPRAKILPESST